MLFTRDTSLNKGHLQTEREGLEKRYFTQMETKKAGIAILISYKIDFEIKAEKIDKEGHFIMIKDQPKKKIHNYKNICTQHRNTTSCKANANN